MKLEFAGFEIDTDRFELTGPEGPVELQPRTLQLLILLARNPGDLISKGRIVDELWDGRAISDAALASQVKSLRRVLGETGKPYKIIGTVHGQGLRMLAPVRRVDAATDLSHAAPEMEVGGEPHAETEPDEIDRIGSPPSLAVLPFKLVGAAGQHGGLADALPDEIITAISRLNWVQVIARGSSFQFPSVMSDLATVREKLDVGYVLSGTLEPQAERLAVSVELADAEAERVLWSERFELPVSDIHALRTHIVDKTVQAVDAKIPSREVERARFKAPDQLTAWERYHFGISNIFTFGRPDYRAGLEHFSSAIELEPGFARAHAGLSHIHWWQMIQQSQEVSPETRAAMFDSASRAVESDPGDPFANLVAGRAEWFKGDADAAEDWIGKAVRFAPSFAMAHGALANLLTLTGRQQEAMPHVDKAIDLSPVDPWQHNMFAIKSAAFIQEGDYEAAADWAARAMRMPHDSLITAQCSLLAMHLAGRTEEARKIAKKVKLAKPDASTILMRRSLPVFSGEFNKLVDATFKHYGLV